MPKKKFHVLLTRLFSISFFILFPLVIAITFLSFYLISMVKQEISVEAEREARLIAIEESRVFFGIRNTLIGIGRFAEVENVRDCNKTMMLLLEKINGQNKQFLNIGLADIKGDLVCSAIPFTGTVNIADREYFKRAVATRDFAFGNYQIGRLTGKPTINFGYPVTDESLSVKFVAFAALDLNALNESLNQLKTQIPGNPSTLIVTDQDHHILVMFPDIGSLSGKSWGADILSSENHEGSSEGTEPFGKSRIFGFSKIMAPNSLSHLHVFVGISAGEITDKLPLNLKMWFFLFSALTIAAAIIGWFISERIIKHLSDHRD